MAQWIVRRDRLTGEQIPIVESPLNKNMWIAGFAGSGKSIVLVHRAIWIVDNNPNAKVVLIVYTRSLVDMYKTGLATLGYQNIEVKTIYEFMNGGTMYDYVLCDEVQDCTDSMIQEIQSRARQSVTVAGDKFQSIFEKDVWYNQPTIDPQTLTTSLNARQEELTTIERLTPSIIEAVDKFLPAMKLATNAKPNAQKVDINIKLCKTKTQRDEATYIYGDAERFLRNYERTAILFHRHTSCIDFANFILDSKGKPVWNTVLNKYNKPDFGSLNRHLAQNGIKLMYIGNGYGSLKEAEINSIGVMMTYQSAKGLDFENVYIPFASSNMFITYSDARSRTIFMVAMTRSGKNLTITYAGQPHSYVNSFRTVRNICNEIDLTITPPAVQTSGNEFDF